jgi:hypothetical protein
MQKFAFMFINFKMNNFQNATNPLERRVIWINTSQPSIAVKKVLLASASHVTKNLAKNRISRDILKQSTKNLNRSHVRLALKSLAKNRVSRHILPQSTKNLNRSHVRHALKRLAKKAISGATWLRFTNSVNTKYSKVRSIVRYAM